MCGASPDQHSAFLNNNVIMKLGASSTLTMSLIATKQFCNGCFAAASRLAMLVAIQEPDGACAASETQHDEDNRSIAGSDETTSKSSNDQICAICGDLNADFKQIDPSALSASAGSKRCAGCMLMLDALEKMGVDVSTLNYCVDDIPPDPSLSIVNEDGCCRITAGELDIEIYASEREPRPYFAHLTHGTDVSGNTASPSTINLIKELLQTCTEKHWTSSACPPNLDVPLPHRVLEIEMLGPLNTSFVRLIEANSKVGTYACLTHCWGPTPLIRTLKSNYEDHKTGIPYTKLPKTFRDAVKVARDLDIPYLWIDSLCIIQDDEKDWQEESAQMASIYQNGRVTISAANSTESSGGCFVDSTSFISKELIAVDINGKTHFARARRFPEHGGWPTLQRAWIFQERLLSPRILHFGHAEVVWECFEAVACECSRSSVGHFHRLDFTLGRKKFSDQWTISPDQMPPLKWISREVWADKWRTIVATYSRLDLTYRSDIFTALSGAAKQLQQHRGSRYLAGMWEDSMIEDLLWHGKEPWQPRPPEWYSPTWSWAIVSGGAFNGQHYSSGVSYMDLRIFGEVQKAYASMTDVTVNCRGSDATTEIKSGQLTLTGPSLAARLERDHDRNEVVVLDTEGSRVSVQTSILSFSADYHLAASGRGYVASDSPLVCLKMAFVSRQKGAKAGESEGEMVYLVLRRSPDVPDMCERIGLFKQRVVGLDPLEQFERATTTVTIV